MRKIPYIFICLLIFFFLPRIALASEPNFAITQEMIYQVHENGNTVVTQNLALTNLTSEAFPQEYLLKIGKLKIFNLQASDRLGPLQISSNVTSSGNEVHLKFNDQVLGQGRILRFTMSYESPEIAQKQGRLWNILISPAPKLPGLTNLAVRLIVPTSFGQKIFAKPNPLTSDLFWDLDNLKSSPINIVFSPSGLPVYQNLTFNLRYHLYNSRLYPVSFQIVLPSDTSSQKIFLQQLTPKPANVLLDGEGNWLAQYPLGPAEKLDVSATGSAMILLQPQNGFRDSQKPENYLKPEKYWPSNDPQIEKIAQTLTTPAAVYNYVLTTLQYTPQPLNTTRPGGRGVLLSPTKAGPQEFSDLFVTLTRARQIPSREVDGYLVGKTSGLHIWSEYFDSDQKLWRMVDPALTKISGGLDYSGTFDLAHLSIFIKGGTKMPIFPSESQIVPATANLNADIVSKVFVSANLPKKITAGFEAEGRLFLENPGPTFFPTDSLFLKANHLSLETPILLTGDVAPFGHQELVIKMKPNSWNTELDDIITLKFGFTKQDYPVKVVPLYKNGYLLIFGGLIVLGILSIITQIARSLLLQKRQGRNNLRGQGQKPV